MAQLAQMTKLPHMAQMTQLAQLAQMTQKTQPWTKTVILRLKHLLFIKLSSCHFIY